MNVYPQCPITFKVPLTTFQPLQDQELPQIKTLHNPVSWLIILFKWHKEISFPAVILRVSFQGFFSLSIWLHIILYGTVHTLHRQLMNVLHLTRFGASFSRSHQLRPLPVISASIPLLQMFLGRPQTTNKNPVQILNLNNPSQRNDCALKVLYVTQFNRTPLYPNVTLTNCDAYDFISSVNADHTPRWCPIPYIVHFIGYSYN